jgi:predicted RNase H-like nuclease (RuvC/YqgF family)
MSSPVTDQVITTTLGGEPTETSNLPDKSNVTTDKEPSVKRVDDETKDKGTSKNELVHDLKTQNDKLTTEITLLKAMLETVTKDKEDLKKELKVALGTSPSQMNSLPTVPESTKLCHNLLSTQNVDNSASK